MTYEEFIQSKAKLEGDYGFEVSELELNPMLFDFQKYLVSWALRKGRAAIFADCGLGKTPMYLEWAKHISQLADGRVLILTPISVSMQTVGEGQKFGIEAVRSKDGAFPKSARIVVTNYERLHYFDKNDFVAAVCDESSILKNFDGVIRANITEFMRLMKYRLLCTATASPNDYTELGTSSEALGYLGYMDMLGKFFKTDSGSLHVRQGNHMWQSSSKFRFRGHAEKDFWRWVCSWSRAMRKPSDYGFDDGAFTLPPLETRQHTIKCRTPNEEFLFDLPAIGLQEQRAERRRTINERCEKVASIVNNETHSIVSWCHLNCESNKLKSMIPDAVEISGKDSDERKEQVFEDFQNGNIRVLVTKPSIAGFGLNWQHCSHQTFFPSHSFEQWYQAIRRSWRFGQKNSVLVDVVTSEGEADVLKNLQRKSEAADKMFDNLVSFMMDEIDIRNRYNADKQERIPEWL